LEGNRWQTVTKVLEEPQTPLHKRYHVVCEDENEFWLVYDPALDSWQVSAAGGTGT